VSDNSDPWRDAIHDALQSGSELAKRDHAVLTGWVIVAEWMTPDGDRWLTKGYASNVTHWQASGMHYEAIHGDWPQDED
jgi:hypothetical protein